MSVLNETLIEKQDITVEETQDLLNTYGKALVVRPTGFGKTYMLIERFAKPYIRNGKNVMYVYPLDIIHTEIMSGKKHIDEFGNTITTESKYKRDKLLEENKNIIFVSYQKLTLKLHEDSEYWHNYLIKHNIGLIILDEAHRAGSESFYNVFETIKDLVAPDNIHILGATATPDRMDDSDEKMGVSEVVFDNKRPYTYGLGEAIADGLIPDIVYMMNRYSVEAAGKEIKKRHKAKFKAEFYEDSFNVEIAKLRESTGSEKTIIAKSISDAGYNPVKEKYYKFIIFLTNKEDVINKAEEIEQWFIDGFDIIKKQYGLKKDFEIRSSYVISSDVDGELTKLEKKKTNRKLFTSTKKVESIISQDYKVDLLFTIDMINMGYHVEDITGIMMLRGTKSEIVYYQQLGRALSVGAEHKPIVMDFVNNIGEKFWFKNSAKHKDTDKSSGEYVDKSDVEKVNAIIKEKGFNNAFKQFMERFDSDINESEKALYEYLYINREMPIYLIAEHLNKPVKEVYKKLVQYEIEIDNETAEMDACIERLKYYNSKSGRNYRQIAKVLKSAAKFIYDPRAKDIQTNKSVETLFNRTNK